MSEIVNLCRELRLRRVDMDVDRFGSVGDLAAEHANRLLRLADGVAVGAQHPKLLPVAPDHVDSNRTTQWGLVTRKSPKQFLKV